MTDTQHTLPKKTREFHNHHFDSTIWNDFAFRDDDIIISTYAKSGTTWVQQIVAQLLWQGAEGLEVAEMSPWLDLRVPPKAVKLPAVAAQTHRRFLKTHLPVDALVFSPKAKYLYGALNETPGLVGAPIEPPPASVHTYFLDWLARDGHPFWPFWENIRSWWALRHMPNVLMLHFEDLKRDMPGQIRRVARFLEISIDETRWPEIVRHCSFDYMKANATKSTPLGGAFWDGGAQTFVHKGVNGRWRDTLNADDVARYEARALAELGPDCASWLAHGSVLPG
jgi:aryl sulfotransferase